MELTFGSVLLLVNITGCATQGRSIGLGSIIGASGGAVMGGVADPRKNGKYRTRNVIIGAAVGGIVGSVAGAAVHQNTEREREISYLKGRESKNTPKASPPSLQQPRVEAQWVESKIAGNRYTDGHFEYIIAEPTRWESPE